MKKYTAQAETVEEAIKIALHALNIDRSQARITVVEEGRKGFLGIGQRDAIVTITAQDQDADNILEGMNLFQDTSQHDPSEGHDDLIEKQTFEDASQDEISGHQSSLENENTSLDKDEETTIQTDGKKDSIEVEKHDEEAIQAAKDYILLIGHKLGADDIEVDVYRELENVYFDIQSEKPGIIIGRHGKVLDAIHTLTQIFLRNHAYSKLNARLDAENYRGRKEESLKALAERAAEKVMNTQQVEILEAMPAKERKIVHRILSSNDAVSTHSEGEEPNRYLVIEPAD